MPWKKALMVTVLYLLFLIFVYLCQTFFLCGLKVFGARPLLLPVAAVGIAAFGGSVKGGAYGLVAGMLCDFSMQRPAIMFTLLLTACCICVGYLYDTVIAGGFPGYAVCSLGVLIISACFQMFSPLVYDGESFLALLSIAVPQTLYSLLFTLPFYFILRALHRYESYEYSS
ncbi:MAG: hypothetical protein IJG63_02890 [Oscillospiraceae bacterium]|nr:hypothetical protein [Oscillospiraceae bacterium]